MRGRKRAMRLAMQAGVEHWWKEVMPGHFETSAAAKYGYEKRTKKYMIYKARKQGHQKPLVFSGALERSVRRGVNLTGTSTRARGAMDAPKYLYQYRTSKPVDKHAELTRVTDGEMQELGEYVTEQMLAELERKKVRERVK